MPAFFRPAVFDSPQQTEQARIVHTIAISMVAVGATFLVLVALTQPATAIRAIIAAAVIIAIATGSTLLARRGHTRIAGWWLLAGMIFLITDMALTAGGIRSPGIGLYLSFIVMAGILLGERSGIVTGGICAAVGLALVIIERLGLLPEQTVHYTPITLWLLSCIYIGVMILLQRLGARAVAGALLRAEQELAERESADHRLQLALNAGGIGVWELDPNSGKMRGDARLFALYGFPPPPDLAFERVVWMARVHHEDRDALAAKIDSLGKTEERITAEFRIVRKGGKIHWVEAAASAVRDAKGVLTSIVGMNVDTTARHEAALEREILLDQLGERVKEVGLLHAAARMLQGNKPLDQRFLQDLVGRLPPAWRFPEQCEARLAVGTLEARTAGWRTSPWSQSISFPTQSGEGVIEVVYLAERPVADEGPFLAEERRLLQSLAEMLAGHIERTQAEENRRTTEGQLRQSQKMDALGTLAGGIAHDFNNILAAIQGNTMIALAETPERGPVRESLGEIARASKRAVDLVKQILLFSRKQETKRDIIALGPLVEEVRKLLRASLPPNIELTTHIAAGLPPVNADVTQLHQILMNLGTNAGSAIGLHGGALTIGLDSVKFATQAEAPSADISPGLYLRLTVSDTGVGMSPEIARRIFEPFFTTKGVRGTGLGLSVVDGIVRDHHGAITLDSVLGKGTTFTVYLPAVEGGAARRASGPVEVLLGKGQRVMYVDDEEAIVFMASRLLPRLGYRCVGFTDAHEALQVLRTDTEGFDAVITDFAMPEMTGLELAQKMREIHPGIPIALSSGYGDDRSKGLPPGINATIPKPATVSEIGFVLGEMLRDPGK